MDNNFIVQLKAMLDISNVDMGKIEQELNKKGIKLEPTINSATTKQQIQNLSKELHDALSKVDVNISTGNIKSAINAMIKEVGALEKRASSIKFSVGDAGDTTTKIAQLTSNFEKLGFTEEEVSKKMKDVVAATRSVNDAIASGDNEKIVSAYQKLNSELGKASNMYKQIKTDTSAYYNVARQEKLTSNIQNWLAKNTAATRSAKEELKQYLRQLSSGRVNVAALDQISSRLTQIDTQMRSMGKLGDSFATSIKKGIASFSSWVSATTIFMGTLRTIKDMVSEVKELDTAQVELSKVSDLTADGLAKVTDQAYEMGEAVAKTGTQVLGAVTEFKRAGYELNKSMDMANAAMVMTNVADGITNTAQSAGTLISVLKGFKMDESNIMSIVDKMNEVSNKSPVSFDNLADGLERVSGTMKESGNNIDQTLGMLTGGFGQLRNMEKVSSGLVTISMRLRGMEEDGEAIDGLSAKLENDFAKIGVAIEDQNGNLRATEEILRDYAKVYPTLTSEQKQYYAELAAGKRQVTVFNAIVGGFEDVDKAIKQSVNSIGSATEENTKYLNSIEGKATDFQSAFQSLSTNLISSDTVKNVVDFGTTIIKFLDDTIDKVGILMPLLGGAGIAKFANNFA